MTIKDLLSSIGPDELEKMDDTTLRQYFEPYIRVGVAVKAVVEEDEKEESIVSLEDTAEEVKKKRQAKTRKAASLADEIRKLAALHGVDAGIPTQIK